MSSRGSGLLVRRSPPLQENGRPEPLLRMPSAGSAGSRGVASAGAGCGRFCGACGVDKLAIRVARFCCECGNEYPNDRAKFCGDCGARRSTAPLSALR